MRRTLPINRVHRCDRERYTCLQVMRLRVPRTHRPTLLPDSNTVFDEIRPPRIY